MVTPYLEVHEFSSDAEVIAYETPLLSGELEEEIENLWQVERARRGGVLFNGQILSATEIAPTHVAGYFVQYRYLIAQRCRPGLFDKLGVRPVGVSGLLSCSDGFVFGRRAESTTFDAGLVELAPSGGVDASGRGNDGRVDYKTQILTELFEEIGISRDNVAELTPFCVVEDINSHVVDIGIAMTAPTLSAKTILHSHDLADSKEYEELRIIPGKHLTEFIEEMGTQLSAVSLMLLRTYQTLERIS